MSSKRKKTYNIKRMALLGVEKMEKHRGAGLPRYFFSY